MATTSPSARRPGAGVMLGPVRDVLGGLDLTGRLCQLSGRSSVSCFGPLASRPGCVFLCPEVDTSNKLCETIRGSLPMKKKTTGRYIVADPNICHGQLTFRGTR